MSIAKASLGWFFANVCSALINFLAVMYFSRKLGASAMGIYYLFFSMLMIFNFVSNGGLSSATIKRLSEGENQYKILAASLLLRTMYLAIISGAIISFRDQLESYLGANLTIYLLLVLFLVQFSDLIREFLQGSYRVAASGFVDFIQQILKISFQIILLGYGLFGLIWGLILGVLFSIGFGALVSRPKLGLPENRDFVSLFHFSKYSYGTNLGGIIYDWLGILAIGYFLNSTMAGIYGVCWSLSSVFLLLGQSISSSLFPEVSSLNTKNKHEEISALFASSISYAPFLSLPGF
ncbi:MAG TPA: oligosaccharide flippase family protein, partial [Methanothrix sp.]|nr:oligosaccharide flippase family protein [Methanothrix sp.]